MEVVLDSDRYVIMEYVSQQAEEFRFAEMYYLLKKFLCSTSLSTFTKSTF